MKIDPYRLLSFAFASADLFVEVVADGTMGFALGAGQKVCGRPEAGLDGLHWREIIAPRDQTMVEALLASLGPAERRGPFSIAVLDQAGRERFVSFSLGRLPPLATISLCFSLSTPESVAFTGDLLEGSEFTREAERVISRAKDVGKTLELSLVELSGLRSAREAMSASDARVLDEKIVGAVRAQSYAGALAGKLGDESYALIRPDSESDAQLTDRLNKSLRAMISELCGISATVRPFAKTEGSKTTNPALTLKRAMDTVARNGAAEGQSLADAVSKSIELTLVQAEAFRSAVSTRQFKLAFQPVVSLTTEKLHHHEVLVRFADGKSPLDTIVMAEELDLIEELDRAILSETLRVLAVPACKHKLAINVSGRSISSPDFVASVLAATRKVKGAGRSLIIEVTESSKIDDFSTADRHIQMLRDDGYIVCLDDFGAGASSLAYLQQLRVDVVKVDGQYIKNLADPRERAMVGHVVKMCQDLDVLTIAEMIETEAIAEAAREVGFNYGQGYYFGHPAAKPEGVNIVRAPTAPLRRHGVVETWG